VSVAQVIGWLLVAMSAIAATRMWWYDRRLQQHRVAGALPSAYRFVPLRWRRDLYSAAGEPLLRGARRALWVMYGCGFAGMVFLAAGAR
jgi:hypothetical protein